MHPRAPELTWCQFISLDITVSVLSVLPMPSILAGGVIVLDKLIPIDIDDHSTGLSVIGLVEDSGTIFISTNACFCF
jgi:hypothetical protein